MFQPQIIVSEPHIYIPSDYQNTIIIKPRRIGEILLEADLVSPAQVEIALRDQQYHQDLHLGEILALRGWIKQETADFFAERWYGKVFNEQKQPLGHYLREAALLTEHQIEVILTEQKQNWLKFGAIAVLKGWLKQNTVDFFVNSLFPEHKLDSIYVRQNKSVKQPEVEQITQNTDTKTLDQELEAILKELNIAENENL